MEQLGIDRGDLVPKKKRPILTFEEGSYTLPELLESHLLPVVAQYDVSRQPIPFHEFNFDLSQPLLLYKKRHIQKVAAHSLYIEDDKYQEVGESILIPEDYKGWFAVLQRLTGNCKADDAVPHFTTIEELANSNTDRFLIGGTKKTNGIQLIESVDSPQQKHEQRQFLPGDILTRDKIYYGETKKRSRLFRKTKYITEKFLKCRDESDREILLPFEQTGIFYQVSHKYGKANKNVMQMSDIVARKLTPRIIKLVFGRFPVTPGSFTGLMRAESSNIETSIIAATMINTKNILMEIPVSSAIYFRVALMDNDLRKNECHRNAMSLCAERAITYMRNIKVCYNFTLDCGTDSEEQVQEQLILGTPPVDECANSDALAENRDLGTQGILRTQLQKSYFQALGAPRVFSVDIPDEVNMRPARSLSTSRMSFCLGNNYLTVPLLKPSIYKRNSGNNNTINEISCKTRRGSRISFNGTFFEEESGDELESESTQDDSERIDIPPPIPCTNISSYINLVSPTKQMRSPNFSEYISTTHRHPSTQPPDSAPPPLPRSSSTSGVSSGSMSPSRDSNSSNRGSADSFEYAVPKIQDSQATISDISSTQSCDNKESARIRRPSTFTFSEGCFAGSKSNSKRPVCETIADEEADDGSPIYENIQTLMELVSKLDDKEIRLSPNDDGLQAEEGPNNKSDEDDSTDNITESKQKLTLAEDEKVEDTLSNKYVDVNANEESHLKNKVDSDSDSKTDNDSITELLNEPSENEEELSFSCEVSASLFTNNSCDSLQGSLLYHSDSEEGTSDMKIRTRRIGVTSMVNTSDAQAFTTTDCSSDVQTLCENNLQANESSDFTECSSVETVSEQSYHSKTCVGECENIAEFRSQPTKVEKSVETKTDEMFGADVPKAFICVDTEYELEEEQRIQFDAGMSADNNENTESYCMWRQALEKAKHSDGVLMSRAKIRTPQKPFNSLTVDEIAEALGSIGIREGTIEQIKSLEVSGSRLTEVLEGELSIRECLCGVNLVDQQKISMFIRGWRPNTPD